MGRLSKLRGVFKRSQDAKESGSPTLSTCTDIATSNHDKEAPSVSSSSKQRKEHVWTTWKYDITHQIGGREDFELALMDGLSSLDSSDLDMLENSLLDHSSLSLFTSDSSDIQMRRNHRHISNITQNNTTESEQSKCKNQIPNKNPEEEITSNNIQGKVHHSSVTAFPPKREVANSLEGINQLQNDTESSTGNEINLASDDVALSCVVENDMAAANVSNNNNNPMPQRNVDEDEGKGTSAASKDNSKTTEQNIPLNPTSVSSGQDARAAIESVSEAEDALKSSLMMECSVAEASSSAASTDISLPMSTAVDLRALTLDATAERSAKLNKLGKESTSSLASSSSDELDPATVESLVPGNYVALINPTYITRLDLTSPSEVNQASGDRPQTQTGLEASQFVTSTIQYITDSSLNHVSDSEGNKNNHMNCDDDAEEPNHWVKMLHDTPSEKSDGEERDREKTKPISTSKASSMNDLVNLETFNSFGNNSTKDSLAPDMTFSKALSTEDSNNNKEETATKSVSSGDKELKTASDKDIVALTSDQSKNEKSEGVISVSKNHSQVKNMKKVKHLTKLNKKPARTDSVIPKAEGGATVDDFGKYKKACEQELTQHSSMDNNNHNKATLSGTKPKTEKDNLNKPVQLPDAPKKKVSRLQKLKNFFSRKHRRRKAMMKKEKEWQEKVGFPARYNPSPSPVKCNSTKKASAANRKPVLIKNSPFLDDGCVKSVKDYKNQIEHLVTIPEDVEPVPDDLRKGLGINDDTDSPLDLQEKAEKKWRFPVTYKPTQIVDCGMHHIKDSTGAKAKQEKEDNDKKEALRETKSLEIGTTVVVKERVKEIESVIFQDFMNVTKEIEKNRVRERAELHERQNKTLKLKGDSKDNDSNVLDSTKNRLKQDTYKETANDIFNKGRTNKQDGKKCDSNAKPADTIIYIKESLTDCRNEKEIVDHHIDNTLELENQNIKDIRKCFKAIMQNIKPITIREHGSWVDIVKQDIESIIENEIGVNTEEHDFGCNGEKKVKEKTENPNRGQLDPVESNSDSSISIKLKNTNSNAKSVGGKSQSGTNIDTANGADYGSSVDITSGPLEVGSSVDDTSVPKAKFTLAGSSFSDISIIDDVPVGATAASYLLHAEHKCEVDNGSLGCNVDNDHDVKSCKNEGDITFDLDPAKPTHLQGGENKEREKRELKMKNLDITVGYCQIEPNLKPFSLDEKDNTLLSSTLNPKYKTILTDINEPNLKPKCLIEEPNLRDIVINMKEPNLKINSEEPILWGLNLKKQGPNLRGTDENATGRNIQMKKNQSVKTQHINTTEIINNTCKADNSIVASNEENLQKSKLNREIYSRVNEKTLGNAVKDDKRFLSDRIKQHYTDVTLSDSDLAKKARGPHISTCLTLPSELTKKRHNNQDCRKGTAMETSPKITEEPSTYLEIKEKIMANIAPKINEKTDLDITFVASDTTNENDVSNSHKTSDRVLINATKSVSSCIDIASQYQTSTGSVQTGSDKSLSTCNKNFSRNNGSIIFERERTCHTNNLKTGDGLLRTGSKNVSREMISGVNGSKQMNSSILEDELEKENKCKDSPNACIHTCVGCTCLYNANKAESDSLPDTDLISTDTNQVQKSFCSFRTKTKHICKALKDKDHTHNAVSRIKALCSTNEEDIVSSNHKQHKETRVTNSNLIPSKAEEPMKLESTTIEDGTTIIAKPIDKTACLYNRHKHKKFIRVRKCVWDGILDTVGDLNKVIEHMMVEKSQLLKQNQDLRRAVAVMSPEPQVEMAIDRE